MSNHCVNPSPRTTILLVLLLACTELLISAPKTTTFLPISPLGCEKVPFKSNPVPYPEYSISSVFVRVTAPSKQLPKVVLELLTAPNIYKQCKCLLLLNDCI